MSQYEESKKVRRIAAVVYVFIMAILVGGSYLSQQQKKDMPIDINNYSDTDLPTY